MATSLSRSPSSNRTSRASIFLALGLVYVLWGSTYLGIRIAVQTLPPFSMAGARFLFTGALMYGWIRWRGGPAPSRHQWRWAWLLGALMLLGGNGTVSWAAKEIPSSLAALLATTTPLWMVLFDWRAGIRPSWPVGLGALVGFVGVGVLLGPGLHGASGSLWYGLAIVGGTFTWALGSYFGQQRESHSSPFMSAAMQLITGGAALFALGWLRGELADFRPAEVSAASLAALGYLVIFGSLIGYTAYIWLLRHTPLSLASTHGYVNPVVAVFLGWGLAGEELNPQAWLAAPLIVGAVVLITTFSQQPSDPEEGVGGVAQEAQEAQESPAEAVAEVRPAPGTG